MDEQEEAPAPTFADEPKTESPIVASYLVRINLRDGEALPIAVLEDLLERTLAPHGRAKATAERLDI